MIERLRSEAPAVLAWAIQGAVKWHAEGLAIPASVAAASTEYMHDNDDLMLWIDERCFVGADAKSKATPLYDDYVKWLKARGQQVPSMKLWGDRMAALDSVSKHKSDGVKVYRGIGLRVQE
jgi:putative DNA primase/helicase